MRPNTRNRRSLGGALALAQYDVHASESEIARDLQQLYQCSLSHASQLLQSDADSDARPEIRAKVRLIQRKRNVSARESECLDAVLGLASLVSEAELPTSERKTKPSIIKNTEPEAKPKAKPQPKPSPAPKNKPKPTPAPPTQRRPPPPTTAGGYMPYPYQYMFPNYLFPMGDKSVAMMPNFPPMQTGLYPPAFNLMYQHGMYGKPNWPMMVSAPVAPPAAPNYSVKRAARHVSIALFIRDEEKKWKQPTKQARLE